MIRKGGRGRLGKEKEVSYSINSVEYSGLTNAKY
jgi:hypothetical protein